MPVETIAPDRATRNDIRLAGAALRNVRDLIADMLENLPPGADGVNYPAYLAFRRQLHALEVATTAAVWQADSL